MGYSQKTKQRVNAAPRTLGNQLGRWAVYLDFSIERVQLATGASRATVYNWFGVGNKPGEVTPAYRERVRALIDILKTHKTAEDAWRKTCQIFGIRN